MKKVSIITIVYNAEAYLEETIKSVISQTYQNIEYIIVDGGSKDGTLDIIKKYENHIAKWISEPDNGLYDAMNKGIDLATGDWFNFLNGGDSYVGSDVLEKIFNSDLGESTLIYGDIIAVKENGEHLDVKAVELKNDKSIIKGMKVCHQAIFYHKSILHKYDLRFKIKAEWKHLIEITRKLNFKPKQFHFPVVYYALGGISAKQAKLGEAEHKKIFLEMYGLIEFIKYTPFFAYMALRRTLKWLIKG